MYLLLAFGIGQSMTDAGEGRRFSVVTAPAQFESRGDGFPFLTVSDATRTYSFKWHYPFDDTPVGIVSFESNTLYTFTILEGEPALNLKHLLKGMPELTNSHMPQIVRIEQNGQLIWDMEVCEVHKVKMQLSVVPIAYGLVLAKPSDPTREEERRLFPHRREYEPGGCVVMPEKAAERYVCNQCKQAFEWWSGTAKAPASVLPKSTPYDHNAALRSAYLASFTEAYLGVWARKQQGLPVFSPTTDEDKARVIGFAEGLESGRTARAAWSNSMARPYGPLSLTPSSR